jgi:hypothetical protein
MGDGGATRVRLNRPLRDSGGRLMIPWLLVLAAALVLGACAAWFLSTRPILYTRLFVPRDERPLVRREILGDPAYGRRMRRIGAVLFLGGIGCLAAAFLIPTTQ